MRGTDTNSMPYGVTTDYSLYGRIVDKEVWDKHHQALKALDYCIKQLPGLREGASGKLRYVETITKGL